MTPTRVALVTGAASGMGQLAARRLASDGVAVAALDVDEEGLARTSSRAPTVRPWTCDVSDAAAVGATVAEVEEQLGPLDRVVNAAAIAPSGLLLDVPVEQVHRMMDVNYGGVVNVSLATLPLMLGRGRGELVQFASLAGWLPSPHFGAYGATKAAVVSFSEVLYRENRDRGVRFACVCPPVVDTPLLEQVTSGPKSLDAVRPLRPDVVLDAVEQALVDGRFFVFPGRGTGTVWRLRRFWPELLWRRLAKMEGLR